jgi:hypothetical protein
LAGVIRKIQKNKQFFELMKNVGHKCNIQIDYRIDVFLKELISKLEKLE